jgi:hypothetical protein|tara:strand:+ start:3925 stop:4800 length:876 start_codon:yes stop_codon:yes gene_type:complete
MLINLSEMPSGFCDRLRLITFVIALAKLKDKKNCNLKIYEKQTVESPYLFSSLCKVKNFKIVKVNKILKNDFSIKMNPYNSSLSIANAKKLNPFKNLSPQVLFNTWKESYKLIEPNDNIKKKINNLKLPKDYISVHVRATDKLVNLITKLTEIPSKTTILESQLKFFIKNLHKDLENFSNSKNVYIACDNEKYKKIIISNLIKYHFKVYYNDIKFDTKKLRQTSGDDFAVDLFVLSKSKIIISSTGGGVPSTASNISKKNIKFVNYVDRINFFYLLNIISNLIFFFRNIFK